MSPLTTTVLLLRRSRATKEMVAVPRGVHRSLVNRYGPRTPAVVAGKPSPLDATTGGVKVAVAPGESADRISVGRGRGRGQGMALVGSSRPLLELTSCTACAALEEERALLKSAEQKEVCARACVRACVLTVFASAALTNEKLVAVEDRKRF